MKDKKYIFLISFISLYSFFSTTVSFSSPAEDVVPLIDGQYFPAVHQTLLGAKKNILCAMFLAQLSPRHPMGWESVLLRDLINAHKKGLEVKVILEDNPQKEHKNSYAYEFLKNAGVAVYYDEPDVTTHSKFVVIDDSITILGSTNWSYHGLRLNHEASVLIRSKEVAQAFRKAFEQIKVKK